MNIKFNKYAFIKYILRYVISFFNILFNFFFLKILKKFHDIKSDRILIS